MLLDETGDPQNSGYVILVCTYVHGLREKWMVLKHKGKNAYLWVVELHVFCVLSLALLCASRFIQ